ncbi:MAG: hypothetical protein K2M05_00870 [Paramuribaculum sp.]|nr:hypothetical protein [Paramuribaculum sp.]MDE6304717.1 hypothetical protein [Paramuribaculum sp.]
MKSHDISSLNSGIYGGKIGYAVLIMAAFQKYGAQTDDKYYIDTVINIVKESLFKINPIANSFMNGNSGIIWGLRKLYNMGVIELSERFNRLVDIIIQHGLSNSYFQSNNIISENEIYSWGITLLSFWDGSDTLTRYLYEEKILLCLIECERILNGEEPYSYLSADKNCALLHSILYLASKAYAWGIGTVRAKRLVDNITNSWTTAAESYRNSVDTTILNALIHNESVCMPNNVDSLAYLGTIAMVYNRPELFLPTYRAYNIGKDGFLQIAPEKLIGIGLGLLSNNDDK